MTIKSNGRINNISQKAQLSRRKIMTKSITRIGICIGVLFMLLACSTKQGQDSISVALFQAPASQALIELIPDFEEETGIKVKYEILPYGDLKSKVEQQFFAQSSNYDVIMADCIWIPTFAERNFLGELDTLAYRPTSYDYSDLLPALDDYLGKYPKGGMRYGMPFMSNTHMLAYRPAIVDPIIKSLNIPKPGLSPETAWTWDQYFQIAKTISDEGKGRSPQIFGTSLQARAGAWLVYEWNSILFGFNQNALERDMGLASFSENAAKAMDYYKALYALAPVQSLTWGHEEETSAICSGLCAMDATSNVELAANLLDLNCNTENEIAFAYPPVGISGVGSPDMGGYGLLLSSFSKSKQFASAFILWAASKEIHRKIVLNGGSPIRYSEISDQTILEKFPYLGFYDRLINDSVYRARVSKWPELEDIISRELSEVMTGDKKSSEATMSIQKWIDENIIAHE